MTGGGGAGGGAAFGVTFGAGAAIAIGAADAGPSTVLGRVPGVSLLGSLTPTAAGAGATGAAAGELPSMRADSPFCDIILPPSS